MASNTNYLWLTISFLFHLLFEEASYEFCGLDAIHLGHIKVCEDELIWESLLIHFLNELKSLQPTDAEIHLELKIETSFEEHAFHCWYAELLIINHKHFMMLVLNHLSPLFQILWMVRHLVWEDLVSIKLRYGWLQRDVWLVLVNLGSS